MFEISSQLKNRRKELGLSLCEVARRADTSAASLSRYENGWNRFEVYTLKKLASALGCRLRITLEPDLTAEEPVSKLTAVPKLKRLFWDRKLGVSDLENHPLWVMERVLEFGSLEDVKILKSLFGRVRFLELVQQARLNSSRTRAFWQKMLEKEGLPCTRKSFPSTADNCWPA